MSASCANPGVLAVNSITSSAAGRRSFRSMFCLIL
jgi:hypothetical protein